MVNVEFKGDTERNEVQIDLDKFLALLDEVTELREQRYVDERNPWQKWVHFAATLDAWRIFPRIFISVYMYLLYYTTIWFMNLESPTVEQAGLLSVVVGAGAAWFGMYASTGSRRPHRKLPGEE